MATTNKKNNLEERLVKNNLEQIKKLCRDLKVIYSDVDGTVVGPEGSFFHSAEKQVTIHPARAIIKIIENNLDLVLISGRSRLQLGADARLLGFKNYISELGCLVVHNLGEQIHTLSEDLDKTTNLYQAITDSHAPDLLLTNFKGYLEYHTPWSEGRECTHVFRGYIDLEKACKLLEENGHKELTVTDNGIIHRRGNLNKNIPEIHAYHLMPKTAGKEKGIRKDLEIRKMFKKNAIAIGDALCDLPMASEVAALFLVANAITKHSPQVIEQIESYNNVFITTNKMGLGFAEIVYSLLGF